MKTAADSDAAWGVQERYEGRPHGWIQWKGTDVCMDVRCACGMLGHIDAEFAYHLKCERCGRVYMVNGHVELILIEREPENCVVLVEDDDKEPESYA